MSATRPCSALMFALLLPVALLPLADLLRQLGQGDQLWQLLLAGAGEAIQEALPILLAIALARGLERERLTSQPLNALLGYLVMSQTVAGLLNPPEDLAIPCALLSAWVSARAHPRLAKVRLPARLRIYTTDALILVQNALLCLLLALPLAGLWHWLAPELWALARDGIRWPQGDWLLGSLLPIMTLLGLAPKLLANLVQSGPSEAVQAAIAASTLVGLPVLGIQLLRAARRQQLPRHQGLWLLLLLACLASGHSQPMLLALLVFYRPLFWLHLLLSGLVMTLSLSLAARWQTELPGGLLALVWQPHALLTNAAGWLLALLTLILSLLLSRLCLRWFPLIPLKEPEQEPSAPVSADISLLAIDYLKAIGGLGNIVSVAAQQHYLQLEVEQPQSVDRHALLALGVLTQFDEQPQRLQLLAGPLAGSLAEKIQQLASRQSVDLQPRRFALRPYQIH
ncbi:hypothetical protein [Pseudaeromonas paramecii]